MKKKHLLALVVVAMLSMNACGSNNKEVASSYSNEPVGESTETVTQESHVIVESTEVPSIEETPVAEIDKHPYSIEFIYCNEESKNLEYVSSVEDDYLLKAIAPYAIITNTSNSTYSIDIDDTVASDLYFEPDEQLRVIAVLDDFDNDDNFDLVDLTTAYTLADGEENIIFAWTVPDIDIDEEPEEDSFTRGMFTITRDDVTSIEERNEFSFIDYNVPDELEGVEGYEIFVVFRNEAGVEIGCLEGNYRTGTLEYHTAVASWASADIYYRYE